MSKKIVQIALMVAVSSVFFSIENYIPTPLPWMRLGLANIITLLALKWWGIKVAVIIVILRVFLGSLLPGKLFTPVFLLSFTGGMTAAFAMFIIIRFLDRVFSLTGVSIIGAFIKNITQIVVVYLMYVRHLNILSILPIFLLSSLISGIIIGIIADVIHKKLSKYIKLS